MYLNPAAANVFDLQKKTLEHYGFDVHAVDINDSNEIYSISPKGSVFPVGSLAVHAVSDYHGFRMKLYEAWDGEIVKNKSTELDEEKLFRKVDVVVLNMNSIEELRKAIVDFLSRIQPPTGPYITRNIDCTLLQHMEDCGVKFHDCTAFPSFYLLALPEGWKKRYSHKKDGVFHFLITDERDESVCVATYRSVEVCNPFAKKHACTKLSRHDDDE